MTQWSESGQQWPTNPESVDVVYGSLYIVWNDLLYIGLFMLNLGYYISFAGYAF